MPPRAEWEIRWLRQPWVTRGRSPKVAGGRSPEVAGVVVPLEERQTNDAQRRAEHRVDALDVGRVALEPLERELRDVRRLEGVDAAEQRDLAEGLRVVG